MKLLGTMEEMVINELNMKMNIKNNKVLVCSNLLNINYLRIKTCLREN